MSKSKSSFNFLPATPDRWADLELLFGVAAATAFAHARGAKIVEGYPQAIDTVLPDPFVWTGLEQSFVRAGFKEVARHEAPHPAPFHLISARVPGAPLVR